MTTFGWKRKAGSKVNKLCSQAFSTESKDEDSGSESLRDWLSATSNKRAFSLEDSRAKSERLKSEGTILAESERYWEAINKWDQAIQLTPDNHTILDMKTQALMAVGESFPSVQAAERTVKVAPTWWVAHQTLGRALANVGELRMALKSFSRAAHLSPWEDEIWTEDLTWAKSLLDVHRETQQKLNDDKTSGDTVHRVNTCTVTELDSDTDNTEDDKSNEYDILPQPVVVYSGGSSSPISSSDLSADRTIRRLPQNYIQMRDRTGNS